MQKLISQKLNFMSLVMPRQNSCLAKKTSPIKGDWTPPGDCQDTIWHRNLSPFWVFNRRNFRLFPRVKLQRKNEKILNQR